MATLGHTTFYFFRKISLKEALDYLEEIESDDDEPKAVYIEPPEVEDGVLSGEDDGEEEEEATPDNVCPGQLKANCEIVLASGRRLDSIEHIQSENSSENEDFVEDQILLDVLQKSSNAVQTDLLEREDSDSDSDVPLISYTKPSTSSDNSHLRKVTIFKSSAEIPLAAKNTKFVWEADNCSGNIPIFPPANYTDCSGITPHEQFEKFFDTHLLQHICVESEKYAIFLGKPNPNITVEELKVFISILLVTGYNYHSRARTLWSTDEDLQNLLVIKSMRRNRFQQILQFLHFEDSRKQSTENDKMWKLRPITDHLKANMITNFHPEQHLSYDESMIAYFGRHGCKQFIKGKPLRFGYKVWSLCTPSGYLVNFEVYQGNNPRSNPEYEERFGKCAAPLLSMIDDFTPNVQQLPFSFYFDNLFTGFPLLAYLKSRGYTATGTIRENRIPKNCPLPSKEKIKKKERGFAVSTKLKETDIVLTKWVDNSVVCTASTAYGKNPMSNVQRYSKAKKQKITVSRPCVIAQYNKYMGGVDRMDQNVSLYRIGNRGKKWWSSIFTWLLDVSVQNAWQLHRSAHPAMSQLEFRRNIAIFYAKHYGQEAKGPGPSRKRKIEDTAYEEIRFDGLNHWPLPIEKKRRCVGLSCNTIGRTACEKCNVGLCLKCFKKYHTQL